MTERTGVYGPRVQLSYNRLIAARTENRADFPPDPASAGQARRFVDLTLRTWSCEPIVDVAVLLVSELVANAVLHARTPIRVVVRRRGGMVRVEVQDGELRAPTRKHYSALATTGRGLYLVERLAADWGVDTRAGGKSVWFELDPSGAGVAAEDAWAFDFDIDEADLGAHEPRPAESTRSQTSGARTPRTRTRRGDLRLLLGSAW